MGAYFSKYKIYYDALQGNDLKGSADSLSSSISIGITSAKNNSNQISGSKWNEQAKGGVVNLIISSIQNNLTKLNDFVSSNLVNACSLAEQLYEKVEEIKKNDELLEELEKEKQNLIKILLSTPSKIDDGIDENGEPKKKNNPKYTKLKNQVDSKNMEIAMQKKHLDNLCDEANQLINQIQALNGNELSKNIFISDFSNKELAEYLSSLSDEELEKFLSTYQGELILEGSLDLVNQFNLKEIIDDMPTIRYDIKAIYDLLEGNEYRNLMIDYLIQYANGDVDIKSFYEKYPDLLPWNSTKSEPIYLFDYQAERRSYQKSESLANALNMVLDHTIASTMLPYYQNGTLTTNKAVVCNSLVLASDFLVHFSYGNNSTSIEKNFTWKTDTSSIIGIGGGTCNVFANNVLFRSMYLFSEVEVTKETNGVTTRILHNDKEKTPAPYSMLFDGFYKTPDSSDIADRFAETVTEEFTPGTVAANPKQVGHVIIYLGEGADCNSNTVYLIADSTNPERGGNGVSIRVLDGSSPKNSLETYKFKITESYINSLDNYSDTPTKNYEDYANKYGVNIN